MKMTNFNWGDDLIYSRDLIARHEELTEEYDSLMEDVESAEDELNEFIKEYGTGDYDEDQEKEFALLNEQLDNANDALNDFNSSYDKDELETLTEVIRQAEDCSDWIHGEGLIHENYFTQYIEDLVNDCYEFPEEFNSKKWPWTHMNMDWDAAAEEAKQDYTEVTVDGHTYYIKA